MRYLIKFSYDGSNYAGFQTQKGLNTIQEKLEEAASIVNNHQKTPIVATGRTDKGVHALCQYAHVDIGVNITEKKLKRALNSNLPEDIHVIETKVVDDSFHARYQVKEKEYQYKLNMGEYNPLERNYVFQYNYKLNVEKMKEAITYFIGEHDFRAFVTDNKEKDNCIRKITKANIEKKDNQLTITFKGNGFLRYQVRNMVGVLIKVGEEKISPETVEKIIESKDRTKAGKTAPPEGLYLVNIKYK
ncbi:MAG: tRNA pseudouridine(38-40) synthase TruA [Bacilli bacterium]|nr:tRNA pseudouridine(38-40) synthase TruA [Bacilli bacterium]